MQSRKSGHHVRPKTCPEPIAHAPITKSTLKTALPTIVEKPTSPSFAKNTPHLGMVRGHLIKLLHQQLDQLALALVVLLPRQLIQPRNPMPQRIVLMVHYIFRIQRPGAVFVNLLEDIPDLLLLLL